MPSPIAPKFTAAKKASIVRAVLDRGMTQRAARAAAAAGELGCEPFTISSGYVHELVTNERERRMLEAPFDTRTAVLAKRVLRKAEKEAERLEGKAALAAGEITQLKKLASVIRDLRAKPWREHGADNAREPTESFLTKLATQAAENGSAIDQPDGDEAPSPRQHNKPSWAGEAEAKPVQDPEQRIKAVLADLERQTREAAARDAAALPTAAEEARAAVARYSQRKATAEGPQLDGPARPAA
jgi:hypothetical protein